MNYSKLKSQEMIDNEKTMGPAKRRLSVEVCFDYREIASIYNTKLKYYKPGNCYYAYGADGSTHSQICFIKEDIRDIKQDYVSDYHVLVTHIKIGA